MYLHVRQNSLHTMIGIKLADGVERKSLHCNLTIGRSEVSATENPIVVRWRVVSGGEEAKLVNVVLSCLMEYLESDGSVEVFGAADVVKATQSRSAAG